MNHAVGSGQLSVRSSRVCPPTSDFRTPPPTLLALSTATVLSLGKRERKSERSTERRRERARERERKRERERHGWCRHGDGDDGAHGRGFQRRGELQRCLQTSEAFRDQEVECCGALGLGYCGGQLCDLSESHHGLVYRVSGESSKCDERGVHSGMGCLQPRLSFPLHQQMVEDAASVPSR